MPFYRSHLPVTGGGTPSATVTDETTFGIAKDAGVAATFSRGDHTHGTPAAPTIPSASGTVSDETSFGVAKDAGVAATFSRGDHTHGTPAAPAVIISANTLRGITPTASTFTTSPTNLSNTTDGSFSTVTGTGSKVMGASGDWGYLTFDMGSIKTILIGARVGLWCSANAVYGFFEASDDGASWKPTGVEDSAMYSNTAAESVTDSLAQIVTGRYVRIRFWCSGAATCNTKIYEVYAFPLAI